MNVENPQQDGGRGDGGVNELTLVLSIAQGTDFYSKRINSERIYVR